MRTRVLLLLVMIAGCRRIEPAAEPQSTTPPSAGLPTVEPAIEPAPVESPKRDVTVRNLGPTACTVAVSASADPPDDLPGETLPVGTKTMAMRKTDNLALQNADGKWGSSARSDGEHGEILIHAGCTGLSVADLGFAPLQVAIVSPHTVDVCCGACDPKGCTACTETKAGARCKGKATIAGKCAVVEGVLDCVPATAVDADGNVGGEYGAMHRLLQAGGATPAK